MRLPPKPKPKKAPRRRGRYSSSRWLQGKTLEHTRKPSPALPMPSPRTQLVDLQQTSRSACCSGGALTTPWTLLRDRSSQEEGQGKAETLFRMGEIAEHVLKDPAGAAALYAEAATTHANHPFAAVSAATALAGAEKWDAAAKAYTALAETARDGDQASRLWRQAADIYTHQLGDTEAATVAHKHAIEASALQPASIDAIIQASSHSAEPRDHADALLVGFQKLSNARTESMRDTELPAFSQTLRTTRPLRRVS